MEQYIKWFENKVRVKLSAITINSITSDEMVSITHKKNLSNIPCGFVDRRNVSPTIWIRNDMSELQTQTTIRLCEKISVNSKTVIKVIY